MGGLRKPRTIPSVQAEGSVLDWKRMLQTDGYAAYDQVGGPHLVHAACWSHVAIHLKKVLGSIQEVRKRG